MSRRPPRLRAATATAGVPATAAASPPLPSSPSHQAPSNVGRGRRSAALSRVARRLPEPDAEAEPDESAGSNPDDPDDSATSSGSGNLKPRSDPLEGLEHGGKPQRKNISLASYTGCSDLYTFVEVFRFQLETSQILEGKRYTPEQSRALFVACLDGDPAIVIRDFILRYREATLDETITCLPQRYSSRLTTTATLDQIHSQKKAPSETYLQLATRLKEMAKSLPGALDNVTNADVVLGTFVEKAYFKFTDHLGSFVRSLLVTNPNRVAVLDAAVTELTALAKNESVYVAKPNAKDGNPKRRKTNTGQAILVDAHQLALAAVVEGKHRPASSRRGGRGGGRTSG
ncbi:hypothetical protein PINS_up012998 [Pythium insidiosum]|nr:hypothetical protein PINS_up012998 [Pythium insidiosum]